MRPPNTTGACIGCRIVGSYHNKALPAAKRRSKYWISGLPQNAISLVAFVAALRNLYRLYSEIPDKIIMSDNRKVIPISKRPIDMIFCVLFGTFAFISIFLDCTYKPLRTCPNIIMAMLVSDLFPSYTPAANAFAPAGSADKFAITPEYAPHAVWPPQFFLKVGNRRFRNALHFVI